MRHSSGTLISTCQPLLLSLFLLSLLCLLPSISCLSPSPSPSSSSLLVDSLMSSRVSSTHSAAHRTHVPPQSVVVNTNSNTSTGSTPHGATVMDGIVQQYDLNSIASLAEQSYTIAHQIFGIVSSLLPNLMRDAVLAYRFARPEMLLAMEFGEMFNLQQKLLDGSVDLAISPVANYLNSAQQVLHPDVLQLPFVSVSVVPIYNLEEMVMIGRNQLTLSRLTLARIFRANITMWDDAQIRAENPALALPHHGIHVVWGDPSIVPTMNLLFDVFCKVDTEFKTQVGCDKNDFHPSTVSYSSYSMKPTRELVLSEVLLTPFSIGFTTPAEARDSQVDTIDVYNKYGNKVSCSLTSLSVAMMELGLNQEEDGRIDISDSSGPSAWPFIEFTYLQLNKVYARSSCQQRAELVKFVSWLYNSPVFSNLADARFEPIIPELISSGLGGVRLLSEKIMCGDIQAVTKTDVSKQAYIASTRSLATTLPFFYAFYSGVDSSLSYQWKETNYYQAVDRVSTGTLSGALVPSFMPYSASPSDSFRLIPFLLTAAVPIFNLPPAIRALDTSKFLPLVIDVNTLGMIFNGEITSWVDVRIGQFNPLLVRAFMDTGANPQITVVLCCTNRKDPHATGNLFASALSLSPAFQASPASSLPLDWTTVWNSKSSKISRNASYHYSETENRMKMETLDIDGAIGYILMDREVADDSYMFRVMPLEWSSSNLRADMAVAASPVSMTQCINVTRKSPLSFQTSYLDLSVPSVPVTCYPLTRLINAVLPASYTGSACDRGNKTLSFFNWVSSAHVLKNAARAAGIARVSDVPNMPAVITNALNSIQCDGENLLVIYDVIWNLSNVIAGLSYSLSAIGIVLTCTVAVLLFYYRHQPVFRSASVPFLFMILGGVCMCFIATILWVQPPSFASCSAFNWCLTLGLTLLFGPLFAKAWRIYRIFNRRSLMVVKISNRKLALGMMALILFDLIILTIWQIKDPFTNVVYHVPQLLRNYDYEHCSPTTVGMPYLGVLAASKFALFLFGSIMSFATRKVKSTFNESTSVAYSIYNVLFSCIIIIPILLLLNTVGDVLVALVLFLILWVTYVSLFSVFLPKFLTMRESFNLNQSTMEHNSKGGSSMNGTSMNRFSMESLDSLPLDSLAKYMVAVRNHLSAVEKKYVLMGGVLNRDTPAATNGNDRPTGKFSSAYRAPVPATVSNSSRPSGIRNNYDADLTLRKQESVVSTSYNQPASQQHLRVPSSPNNGLSSVSGNAAFKSNLSVNSAATLATTRKDTVSTSLSRAPVYSPLTLPVDDNSGAQANSAHKKSSPPAFIRKSSLSHPPSPVLATSHPSIASVYPSPLNPVSQPLSPVTSTTRITFQGELSPESSVRFHADKPPMDRKISGILKTNHSPNNTITIGSSSIVAVSDHSVNQLQVMDPSTFGKNSPQLLPRRQISIHCAPNAQPPLVLERRSSTSANGSVASSGSAKRDSGDSASSMDVQRDASPHHHEQAPEQRLSPSNHMQSTTISHHQSNSSTHPHSASPPKTPPQHS